MSTYELTDVDLEEVSCVDHGANQHADVVLAKRSGYNTPVKPENAGVANEEDGSVTVEELTMKLESFQTQVADLTKRAQEAEAAAEQLRKSAEDAGLDIVDGKIAKRAAPEYVEVDGEKVEKSLVPAPVLRAIEKQAAEVAALKKQAEEAELAKRGADELPNLAGTPLAKGRLLALAAADEEVLKALRAANAAMAEAYVEKGHSKSDDTDTPSMKLDRLAKAYADTHKTTFETGYAEVTKTVEGAQLLAALRAEAN